ncbi:MAG: NADH-quinone oxidoreductase subunit C [Acidobacteria bacterium]|nr:NADH-quinone oxidoreductase subunit C [Acidobacteriota bacterium]
MDFHARLDALRQALPDVDIALVPSVDQPTLVVPADAMERVARQLREHPSLQFQVLAELTAVDVWPREPRFEVVYHFVSMGPGALGEGVPPAQRLRVKVRVAGDQACVPTITRQYPNANWYEREVFDLFGVTFDGHPDLRRILMPDDWEGHPARKDYPVQIHKAVDVGAALQVTEEEFVRNIERQKRTAGATAGVDVQ